RRRDGERAYEDPRVLDAELREERVELDLAEPKVPQRGRLAVDEHLSDASGADPKERRREVLGLRLARVAHRVDAVFVLRRHRERVLDGARLPGEDGEHAERQRVRPTPVEEGRILG